MRLFYSKGQWPKCVNSKGCVTDPKRNLTNNLYCLHRAVFRLWLRTWCMADVWQSGSREPPPPRHTSGSSQTAPARSGGVLWWHWSGAATSANSHSPSCPGVLVDWNHILIYITGSIDIQRVFSVYNENGILFMSEKGCFLRAKHKLKNNI